MNLSSFVLLKKDVLLEIGNDDEAMLIFSQLQATGLSQGNKNNALKSFRSWTVETSKRDTYEQSGLLDSEGAGEGGMIWENGIETCILSCKK